MMSNILELNQLASTTHDLFIGNVFKVSVNTLGLNKVFGFVRGHLNWDPAQFRHPLYRTKLDQCAAYILKHSETGKMYVGSSSKVYTRIARHKFLVRVKSHSNSNFTELLKTSDIKEFMVTIIFTDTRSEAYALEQHLVNHYQHTGLLLNTAVDVRHARLGARNTAEHIEKIVAANTGRTPSSETRQRMSDFHRTDEKAIKQFSSILEAKKRSVSVNSVVYGSLAEAAKLCGIPESSLRKMLNKSSRPNIKWIGENTSPLLGRTLSLDRRQAISEFRKTDLKAIDQLNSLRQKTKKKITLNGIEYESIAQAESATGINQSVIHRCINASGQQGSSFYTIDYCKTQPRRVRILGKEYASTALACKELDLSKNYLKDKLSSSSQKYIDYEYIS